ncbi:MAG TPA: hypothetical protein DC058_24620 [Planctomycetaceae bacterium]|nr:hypothetical protein [Planctomycetaceae bacterium]
MLELLERPLSERELQALSRQLEITPLMTSIGSSVRWLTLATGIMGICVFLFVRGLFRQDGPTGVWIIVVPVVVPVGIIAFYVVCTIVIGHVHWSRFARQFAMNNASAIRAAIDNGLACVCRVRSDSVVVVQEDEDGGSAYIFDLGDGSSLYLRGQEYFPDLESSPWPARQFEIVRTQVDRLLVGVFAGSEPAADIREVRMSEMPESFWFADEPESESILPGAPTEVLARLGHQQAVRGTAGPT